MDSLELLLMTRCEIQDLNEHLIIPRHRRVSDLTPAYCPGRSGSAVCDPPRVIHHGNQTVLKESYRCALLLPQLGGTS